MVYKVLCDTQLTTVFQYLFSKNYFYSNMFTEIVLNRFCRFLLFSFVFYISLIFKRRYCFLSLSLPPLFQLFLFYWVLSIWVIGSFVIDGRLVVGKKKVFLTFV